MDIYIYEYSQCKHISFPQTIFTKSLSVSQTLIASLLLVLSRLFQQDRYGPFRLRYNLVENRMGLALLNIVAIHNISL